MAIDLKTYTAKELNEQSVYCEYCGLEKVWHRLNLLGKDIHISCYDCNCIDLQEKQKERLRLAMQHEEVIKRFHRYSNLGRKEFTFENWEHNAYTQLAEDCFNTFKKFLNSYRLGNQGMIVYGETGCGKTHLSVALANELANRGFKVILKNVPTLFEEIFNTFNNHEVKTSDVINPIINSDIVILDDLGAEKPSDFVRSKLYYIINNLYNNNATLIVTSNVDNVSDLKDIIGFRTYDRLLEMCDLVHNKGISYRRFLATNKLNQSAM